MALAIFSVMIVLLLLGFPMMIPLIAAAFDIDGVSLHPGAVAAYADAGYLA